MSYPQIPQAQFGGQATASPNQGVDGNELSENIQALDLNQQQQQAATSTKRNQDVQLEHSTQSLIALHLAQVPFLFDQFLQWQIHT